MVQQNHATAANSTFKGSKIKIKQDEEQYLCAIIGSNKYKGQYI